jgi:hypothetical protein
MWLLLFLPDAFLVFVVNAILIVGIVATVVTFFFLKYLVRLMPALNAQVTLMPVVSVVILLFGVYFKGGQVTEQAWRQRVAEVEAQLEEARKESAKVNTVVETKVVTKTKVIKEKSDALIEYVDREVIREAIREADCRIPQEVIDVHNEAARMNQVIEQQRKGAK